MCHHCRQRHSTCVHTKGPPIDHITLQSEGDIEGERLGHNFRGGAGGHGRSLNLAGNCLAVGGSNAGSQMLASLSRLTLLTDLDLSGNQLGSDVANALRLLSSLVTIKMQMPKCR